MKTIRFNGKTVLVVGGSSGIGEQIVNDFLDEGAFVIIADTNKKNRFKNINFNYKQTEFHQLDVTDEDSIIRMIKNLKNPKIDILVYCVRGPRTKKKEMELTFKEWMESLQVILGGSYVLSKHIIPLMKKQKKGVIINIGSILGTMVGQEPLSYHVAKAGLIQLTRCLAERYGPENIRVNSISPGFIVKEDSKTRFEESKNKSYRNAAINIHPLRKIGSQNDVSNGVLFLASDNASFITGENLIIDGGQTIRDQWSIAEQFRDKK